MTFTLSISSPTLAIAALANYQKDNPEARASDAFAVFHSYGQQGLNETLDLYRHVIGIGSFAIAIIPKPENVPYPPLGAKYIPLSAANYAIANGNTEVVSDLAGGDHFPLAQLQGLVAAEQQSASAVLSITPYEINFVTPVVGLTAPEIEAIAKPYLVKAYTEFYLAAYEDRAENPLLDGDTGYWPIKEAAEKFGIEKGETWADAIPELATAKAEEIWNLLTSEGA